MPYAECVTSTLFSRIINHEIPGTFVYRDDLCVGFMTISPITTGHTLVVPIKEVDQWTDLTADLNSHLFGVAKIIGDANPDFLLGFTNTFNYGRFSLYIVLDLQQWGQKLN